MLFGNNIVTLSPCQPLTLSHYLGAQSGGAVSQPL